MQWEQLTAPEFAAAVRKTDVCVFPMGVVERHGDHLPIGTDFLVVHKIACLAAEREPAVVFPPWYFGQIYEARCFPGTLTVKPTLLMDLFEGVFDEIGRNGFKKIILLSGHGGNKFMTSFLAQCALWQQKPYSLYVPSTRLNEERQKQWNALCETSEHGHACECETSISLACHPELVKMNAVGEKGASARGRLNKLPGIFTGIGWYADYPEHYAGDARSATAEKGRAFLALMVDSVVEYIAAVKADKTVPALEAEFFKKATKPSDA